MKGIIESYSEQKRFGFIKADNGTRAIFYRESIEVNGYMTIKPGDRVSFEIVDTIRGPEAKKIKLLVKRNSSKRYIGRNLQVYACDSISPIKKIPYMVFLCLTSARYRSKFLS